MSCLRTYFCDDDVESKLDSNTNLLAFRNGYLYDISITTYRQLEKYDFITKTMLINYNRTINTDKNEEIHQII